MDSIRIWVANFKEKVFELLDGRGQGPEVRGQDRSPEESFPRRRKSRLSAIRSFASENTLEREF